MAGPLSGMKVVELAGLAPGPFAAMISKAIEDVTPLPHNGCRPPKKRRV